MMELFKIPKSKGGGLFLRVEEKDALRIIESLVQQMSSGSPNVGRAEFQVKGCGYFSIAVHKELP